MKLFMTLLGCKPPGRLTEQHDIFFGVGSVLKDLVPAIRNSWPQADPKIHIDAWREVNLVDGYGVSVVPRNDALPNPEMKLFFVNLGGYKKNEFEEYHFKRLVVADTLAAAIRQAKETVFWETHVSSHIDDKYGLDVDDIYEVEDLLPAEVKSSFALEVAPAAPGEIEDQVQNGYFKLSAL